VRIHFTYNGKSAVFDKQIEKVIVGRPKENVTVELDLTPDESVSRPHACIWIEGDQYWVEDLGSTRGTLVSGEEIKDQGKRQLLAGNTIQIGNTILRVELPVSPEASATSESMIDTGATLPADPAIEDGRLEIGKSISADSPMFGGQQLVEARAAQRLALLCELPLQFAERISLESLMQTIVERLLTVIPGALRGALLMRERTTGHLLLKAHVPTGKPSISMTLAQRAIERREAFIWQHGDDLTASLLESSCWSGMYAPLLWGKEVLGVICVDHPNRERFFDEEDLELLLAVARYSAIAVVNRQLQEDLKQNAALLSRLLTNFSPKVRDNLLKKARNGKLRLGGERSEVTILYSDIRGFTRMSAAMDAEDVVEMLNEYFAALVNAIFRYNGTVDKFVGDAVLAVFGSPEHDPKQHENAVRASLEMQAAVTRINEARHARGLVTCNMGIGINCGEVLHGFIGSSERMEFTVIGDVVNKTARFCDGAQAGEILIGPELHQHVWRTIVAEAGSIPTKHEGTLSVYSVKELRQNVPIA
jgi:adenylate cyclase